MKPLSYTQKKWAMTTFLVGVLTVSTSLHQPALTSEVDLASTDDQVEGNLATSEGLVKVKYIKNGEEVIAVVPKTVEGKLCDACGKSYNLSVAFDKNKGDIDSLNVALLKHIAKSKDKATEDAPAKEDQKEDKLEKAKREKDLRDRRAFKNALGLCDTEEKSEKIYCLVDKYMEVIKAGRKAPSADLSLEILKKELEPNMISALLDTKTPSNDYEVQEALATLKPALLKLDQLQSELPADYNLVRARILYIERNIMEKRISEYKKILEKVKANSNDHASHNQAGASQRLLLLLNRSLDSMNNPESQIVNPDYNNGLFRSLRAAVEAGYIKQDDALKIYREEYEKTVSKIMNGVLNSYQNFGSVVNPSAISLDAAAIASVSPRTNLPTGGAVTRSTLPAGVVNGQGQQIGTPALPGQQPQQGRTFQGRGF